MKYVDYIKTIDRCPFCSGIHRRIVHENEHAYLTYSLAPYHKYHLLVIPKRHVERLIDLTWSEEISIMALLSTGIKALDKLKIDDCSILVKDNYKSVPHLHYHIIPDANVTDISEDVSVRRIITDQEEEELIRELRKIAD